MQMVLKDALKICLNEMLDYIGYIPEDGDDSEDEDYYFNYDRKQKDLSVK